MRKLFYNDDNHCSEFIQFADNILESSVVVEICEQICEFGGSKVHVSNKCSLDREGANHEICGQVDHFGREFAFRAVSGNWNGLEILDWEENGFFQLSNRWYE